MGPLSAAGALKIARTGIRVVKTVFLENGVFVPYRKQVVLTKNGENADLHSTHKNKGLRSSEPRNYAAPIGAFFCPEICAFTGFWGEISSTASKVLSDRKVLFKHKNWPLMAVNGR